MTDDILRYRIAEAIYGQIQSPVPPFDEQPPIVQQAWLDDADAVIAALKMRRESLLDGIEPVDDPPAWHCRWVTDWEAYRA